MMIRDESESDGVSAGKPLLGMLKPTNVGGFRFCNELEGTVFRVAEPKPAYIAGVSFFFMFSPPTQ